MEKTNLNVMIFDDDQQPTQKNDLKKYTSQSRSIKPSTSNAYGSQKNIKNPPEHDKMTTISKQINDLQSKIKTLQKDGQKIRQELQKRNGSTQANTTSNNLNQPKTKQIEQILMVVEKKIQLIIQQSKKLITRMSETVEKKLIQLQKEQQNQKLKIQSTNEKNSNKINQVQTILRQKLQDYEKHYRNEYEKIVKETKRKEETMMKRLSQIQLKFANKLNSFETKEKQYVDWIHHLQAKLKQRKSKKMITITQQKPQLSPIQSKATIPSHQNIPQPIQQNLQNMPSANFQTSKMNCSIDQNNSKIIRKHKIFGGGKSTSPAPRGNSVVSPTKDSVIPQQMMNNPQIQPSGSSFYQQNSKGGTSNLNFYNDLRRQDTERSRQNGHPNDMGWDKFADLNDFNEEYTETQSDDFFTPIDQQQMNTNYDRVLANIPLDSRGGTYYGEPFRSQRSYQNNLGYAETGEKVFSPFDLN